MSECVVRMEIPSCCHDCPFEADQWDYPICRVTGRAEGYRFDARNNRMVDCPIVCSLPEGHGRLADKDEMLKKIENYHRYMTMHHRRFSHHLEGNLTHVVPAERSEA